MTHEVTHEVVFLSDRDVREMISMKAVIDAVEDDLRRQARPESMILGVPLAYQTDDRKLGFRWRLKTAIIRDIPVAGTRITGYKIDADGAGGGGERDATRYILLADPKTARPLAIIDEHTSFGMRTAASVCVAAKYLARRDSKVIGIIGVGNVGRAALAGLAALFKIAEVRVTSARPESRERFAEEQRKVLGVPIAAVGTAEEVCRGADIIMSATPSPSPFIRYEWLRDGVFLGVMGHEEATHEVYRRCDRMFVDYDPAVERHPAHIQHAVDASAITADRPLHQIWKVVAGELPGRRDALEKVLVATVGLTTQDTAIAHALYRRALAEGRGMRLPF